VAKSVPKVRDGANEVIGGNDIGDDFENWSEDNSVRISLIWIEPECLQNPLKSTL